MVPSQLPWSTVQCYQKWPCEQVGVNGWVNAKVKQCVHGRMSEFCKVSYGSICKLKLEFILHVREGNLCIVFYHNITHQIYFQNLFYALHPIYHSRRPGTIWLHVGLSNWLLWSCEADCLAPLFVGLSDGLPWSHADCLVPEQTNAARFIWHMIAQWQLLHQFGVTAHENGSANRPVGCYKYKSFKEGVIYPPACE